MNELDRGNFYHFEVNYTHSKRGEAKISDYAFVTVKAKTEKEAEKNVTQNLRSRHIGHTFGKILPKLIKVETLEEYIIGLNPNKIAEGGGVGKKDEMYQESKWLTKEQWEKWSEYVKTGKIDGKKENNIFNVARWVGVPASKISAYEIEQRAKKYNK